MSLRSMLPLVAIGLAFGPHHLPAQETHTLGLNVLAASSPTVGVTWQLSRSLALRPSVAVSWDSRDLTRVSSATGMILQTSTTLTQAGLDLDLLVTMVDHRALTSYLGVGGYFGGLWRDGEGNATWAVRTFLGIRIDVLDRVALFGEVGVEYDVLGFNDVKALRLSTAPLGILLYLN